MEQIKNNTRISQFGYAEKLTMKYNMQLVEWKDLLEKKPASANLSRSGFLSTTAE